MLEQRKNKEAKSRFDRDQMYDSILRASQVEKDTHEQQKSKHE
jgi:hypothetical protein